MCYHLQEIHQNQDGGFGGGLEPDSWNPESSPYTTLVAAGVLRGIGLEDESHPVVKEILRFADRQSGVYEKAARYVDRILDKISGMEDFGEMGADGLGTLLHDIEERGLEERFDVSVIRQNLKDIVDHSMERDPEQWQYYTHRPSEFIWSADCPFYAGNEEIVDRELDYTIETRRPGGVWDITWTWFDLGEQYGKEFAVSENWWKAKVVMDLGSNISLTGGVCLPLVPE